MNAADQLRAKFEADLKALQDACPHTELTEPMPYMWAPGHYGPNARWCKHCSRRFDEPWDPKVQSLRLRMQQMQPKSQAD
jgi:hypothetical protein